MIRWLFLAVAYVVFYLVAMLLAPVLPAFAVMREGPADNNNRQAIEPRLPAWLFWFDTSYDNGLWGDTGWRTKHCQKWWGTYFGMVRWLWRNAACGFCWSVLARKIDQAETFTYTHSGNGLDVDKGQGKFGWYFIKSSRGAFSLRWCREWNWLIFNFEAGWLLDIYVKSEQAKIDHPRAAFQFQPQIKPA